LIVDIDSQQNVSLVIGDLMAIVQWANSTTFLAYATTQTAFLACLNGDVGLIAANRFATFR